MVAFGFEYLLYPLEEFAIGEGSEEFVLAVAALMRMVRVDRLALTTDFVVCKRFEEFIFRDRTKQMVPTVSARWWVVEMESFTPITCPWPHRSTC